MGVWKRVLATALLALIIAAPAAAGAEPPSGDRVLEEWAKWPYQAYCGGQAISPLSVFASPADAESGSLPSEAALREIVNDPSLAWIGLAHQGWRLLAEDADSASFVSGEIGEEPRSAKAGLRARAVWLPPPSHPPGPRSMRIRLVLGRSPGCSSARLQLTTSTPARTVVRKQGPELSSFHFPSASTSLQGDGQETGDNDDA